MTTLVSINTTHAGASLHRYETTRSGPPVCTHGGVYDLHSVTAPNVEVYRALGAAQDRIGPRACSVLVPGRLTRQ